jgi:energy-coupling factor transporter ATP-binding protein EcfA2
VKLVSFSVNGFRSVKSSGKIEVAAKTVLVGRNESGKTAILKALHAIKSAPDPASGDKAGLPELTFARDFPRDRPRSEFNDGAVVTNSRWELNDADRAALASIWSRAAKATHVTVQRPYRKERRVGFEGLKNSADIVAEARRQAESATKAARNAAKTATGNADVMDSAIDDLRSLLAEDAWGATQVAAVTDFKAAMSAASLTLGKAGLGALAELERAAALLQADETQHTAARQWVADKLPVFVYLDDWDFVPGQHNISDFLARRDQNKLNTDDKMFQKLLKVAELSADELQKLLSTNHEERTLLTDRAGQVFTRNLRQLWKDRKVEVQFRVDAQHFDVLVRDEDTNALVPLDERSRGFRWYFSFYATFTADTLGGDKANAILLLDEPGLFLHATAQHALLQFFKKLQNQIIFTTHSPFMIDAKDLKSARTVNLETESGTNVSGDLSGDAKTLFPLQAALGYDITQTMFIGSKNVVIEGVTDYWYLRSVADFLAAEGTPALPEDLVLTPAGGAPKVTYLVSLLTAQNLNVIVLLDSEPSAAQAAEEMIKAKLIRKESVIHVAMGFDPEPKEADIEDLIDPKVFVDLAEEAYKKELTGKTLAPNAKIPRIVPRLEDAFSALGLTFNKSRVARLFLDKMGKKPESVLTTASRERFARLFEKIDGAYRRLEAAAREPFA